MADLQHEPWNEKNRDLNNLSDHLKVHFTDVFGEPEAARSLDCCWKCSWKCFECAKNFCYILMTTLCACPIAFSWGCNFACITFAHVWYYTPCYRVWTIECGCWQKFLGTFLQCCLGPFCEVLGLCFSRIVVKNC